PGSSAKIRRSARRHRAPAGIRMGRKHDGARFATRVRSQVRSAARDARGLPRAHRGEARRARAAGAAPRDARLRRRGARGRAGDPALLRHFRRPPPPGRGPGPVSAAARAGRAEIAAAIEELEREHETMDAQWRRLRQRLLAVVEGEPRLAAEEVTRFAWLYRRHMDREGAAVLPFAREALDAAERAALG